MTREPINIPSCFTAFKEDIDTYSLPDRFTFPFSYTPHPLALLAAEELQQKIANEDLGYHYGLEGAKGYGKMFGVLVVENTSGQIGYLAAFSGKMGEKSILPGFVPPVYNRLSTDGFFLPAEKEISDINALIKQLESSTEYIQLKQQLEQITREAEEAIAASAGAKKEAKKDRDKRRKEGITTLSPEHYAILEVQLENESKDYHYQHKRLTKDWKTRIAEVENALGQYEEQIKHLKEARKQQSAALQQQLFDEYQLLNSKGQQKGLCKIFDDFAATLPPAGAGDCAAPKLLQYAFTHQLQPVCMAEFWWGASPVQEVRKHGHFYPACRGKCEPILNYMLEGMALDPNPNEVKPTTSKAISIIYEDEYLLVINKPEKLLSVPGKVRKTSVYSLVKEMYPDADGPLLVHRLDMATSGLLLVAKNEELYKALQAQFIERTVKKRYVALLDGVLTKKEGTIDLPLRVDLDNRPHQLVCYAHGKPAVTKFEVIKVTANKTLVYFYPLTGRTHQLRVHAAHQNGLNTPIMGDELYGTPADRLYLHAEQLSFQHPVTGKAMTFQVEAGFTHF